MQADSYQKGHLHRQSLQAAGLASGCLRRLQDGVTASRRRRPWVELLFSISSRLRSELCRCCSSSSAGILFPPFFACQYLLLFFFQALRRRAQFLLSVQICSSFLEIHWTQNQGPPPLSIRILPLLFLMKTKISLALKDAARLKIRLRTCIKNDTHILTAIIRSKWPWN